MGQLFGGRRGRGRGIAAITEEEEEQASEYEDSDNSSPSEGGKAQPKAQAAAPVVETLEVMRDRLTGAWNATQLKTLRTWLLNSGYGRWQELLESSNSLSRTKHLEQVQAMAECVVQLCFHNDDDVPPTKLDEQPKSSRSKRRYHQILEAKSLYGQVKMPAFPFLMMI